MPLGNLLGRRKRARVDEPPIRARLAAAVEEEGANCDCPAVGSIGEFVFSSVDEDVWRPVAGRYAAVARALVSPHDAVVTCVEVKNVRSIDQVHVVVTFYGKEMSVRMSRVMARAQDSSDGAVRIRDVIVRGTGGGDELELVFVADPPAGSDE